MVRDLSRDLSAWMSQHTIQAGREHRYTFLATAGEAGDMGEMLSAVARELRGVDQAS
jgi:hypothetical protein